MNANGTALPKNHYEEASSALVLDGVFQSFMIGLVIGQAVKYWVVFPDDSRQKRIFTASVVLLSITQTIIEVYKLWLVVVHHRPWSHSVLSWTDLFFNGCICSLCQSFFIRRCWKMTDKKPWVLYPLSMLAAFIAAINVFLVVNIAMIFHHLSLDEKRQGLVFSSRIAFTLWISLSLFLDITVASILVTVLWRSKAGTAAADDVIHRVIGITFQSAVLPATSMIIAVSLYRFSERANLTILFTLMAGKFYAFGLLRTLNARQNLRLRMQSNDLGRVDLTSWQWNSTPIQEHSNTEMIDPLVSPTVCGTARGSVNSGKSTVAVEGIAHGRVAAASGIPSELQLSSPRLDAFERGSMTRNRISSRN